MKKNDFTRVSAPGKLILSGEHAVVYGNPALVMAVNRYVTTDVVSDISSAISLIFPELNTEQSVTIPTLMQLQKRVRHQYQLFQNSHGTIRDVLQQPIELVQFAISLLLEATNLSSIPGIKIKMKTDLAIGCGMGSSAAVVISVLTAVAHHLQLDISPQLFFKLAHEAETMQHGKSSGLDLQSSLQGGCLFFQNGQVTPRLPFTLSFYMINTGQPQTTTGECVKAVANHFKNSSLSKDFSDITQALDQALQANHKQNVMTAIRENHKLLNTIGVVPQKIQSLIQEIEKAGGAAKISGAGAVAGDHAGVLLMMLEDEAELKNIAMRYQQLPALIQCEPRGVYVHESL